MGHKGTQLLACTTTRVAGALAVAAFPQSWAGLVARGGRALASLVDLSGCLSAGGLAVYHMGRNGRSRDFANLPPRATLSGAGHMCL